MNEFFGVIKLKDGTEIIGKVLVCDDQDGFIIEDPFEITLESINVNSTEMFKVDLKPWVKFSEQCIYFIDKSSVFTVAKADPKIRGLYNNVLRKHYHPEASSNKVSLDAELGFKNNVTEARELLEKSFKLDLDHQSP